MTEHGGEHGTAWVLHVDLDQFESTEALPPPPRWEPASPGVETVDVADE